VGTQERSTANLATTQRESWHSIITPCGLCTKLHAKISLSAAGLRVPPPHRSTSGYTVENRQAKIHLCYSEPKMQQGLSCAHREVIFAINHL